LCTSSRRDARSRQDWIFAKKEGDVFFSEISASLYAWDLADEGVEHILDILQELTYCN